MSEHTEQHWSNVGKFYKTFNNCFNQPLVSLTQLNMKTLSDNSRYLNKRLESFLDLKEPKDFVSLCMEQANETTQKVMEYNQQVSNIMVDASRAMFELFTDMTHEFVRTTEKAAAATTRASK